MCINLLVSSTAPVAVDTCSDLISREEQRSTKVPGWDGSRGVGHIESLVVSVVSITVVVGSCIDARRVWETLGCLASEHRSVPKIYSISRNSASEASVTANLDAQ